MVTVIELLPPGSVPPFVVNEASKQYWLPFSSGVSQAVPKVGRLKTNAGGGADP
jgi:hypothetical protein